MSEKLIAQLIDRPELSKIQTAFDAVSGELYLVGGTIRDAFLNRTVTEFDLATNLSADVIESVLTEADIPNYRINREHQTVLIPATDHSMPMEITSYRSRTKELGKSIEEDLALRDFTMNALACSVRTKQLLDLHRGLHAIHSQEIKAVGSDFQERFAEDPLRLLRMIRLAVQLGFAIKDETWNAAQKALLQLHKVSVERIRSEFDKILLSPDPRRGFTLLYEIGFLREFAPEIETAYGVEQNRFHTEDVFHHTMSVVELSPPELDLRLAALVHDLGKPGTLTIDEVSGERHFFKHEVLSAKLAEQLLTRFKYSNQQVDDAAKLAALHMRPVSAGAAGLRRLLRDTGQLYTNWRILKEADSMACKRPKEEIAAELKDFDERIAEIMAGPQVMPLSSLAVSGNDLMESLGLPECPQIGIILRALHEIVLDDPTENDRDKLLNHARQMAIRQPV